MESFIAQPGVPILTFSDAASDKIPVAQQRFFLSPSSTPDPAQKWTIPVCCKSAESSSGPILTPENSSLRPPQEVLPLRHRQRHRLLPQLIHAHAIFGHRLQR